MKITCTRVFSSLKVYLNGILHIHIDLTNHEGLTSWYETNGKHKLYFIEFCRKNGSAITVEHDSFENWKEILRVIDENL